MALLYIRQNTQPTDIRSTTLVNRTRKGSIIGNCNSYNFPPSDPTSITHSKKTGSSDASTRLWKKKIKEEQNLTTSNYSTEHDISKNCKDRNGKKKTKKHDLNTHFYQLVQINYWIYVYLQD